MKWEIFERIYSSHWFLSSYNGPGFVRDFPRIGGGTFMHHAIYIMGDDMCRYVFEVDEFEKAAQFTAHKLINNDKWRSDIYRKINFYTKRYLVASERLRTAHLDTYTNLQLTRVVKQIIPLQHYHQVYSILANGVVLDGRNHFSDKIRNELRGIIGEKFFNERWSLLSQTTKMSLRQKKDYAIARLALNIKKSKPNQVEIKLRSLHKQYCWLDYNNFGPAATLDQFRKELAGARRDPVAIKLPQQLLILRKSQKKLIQKLKVNSRGKFLIRLAQHIIWQKGYRKDIQYHGFYCYEALWRELARRKGVTDWKLMAFLFPWEVEKFITSTKPSVTELKKRREFSCFIVTHNRNIIKLGTTAREYVKALDLNKNLSKVMTAKGQCAYAGVVKGIVKIVQIPADMKKMKKGDILVSQATSPDLLPAMKIAGAFVTNTGGLICHAAITSRELKIPCIVGTANATLIFKDGDMVEVDATNGVVKKIG